MRDGPPAGPGGGGKMWSGAWKREKNIPDKFQKDSKHISQVIACTSLVIWMDSQTDRQRDRLTDWQTDGQTLLKHVSKISGMISSCDTCNCINISTYASLRRNYVNLSSFIYNFNKHAVPYIRMAKKPHLFTSNRLWYVELSARGNCDA